MPEPVVPFVDSIFHGLFSTIDPLGMVLRTLMALLSDALAQLTTGAYVSLFATTQVDFSTDAVGSIWRITTGLSAALATVLLVVAAFRGMVAQSTRYVTAAVPGVVAALLGPQAAAIVLPVLSAALSDLAETIVRTATPDLAESIRLLAGVGSNPIYEGLGLLAPLIAAVLLFGLSTVFVVLLFCMAGAVVLFVLSPFAFAGLVMGPTRAWFTRWATAMFAVLFAKVPIAILLALSVSLFADSRYAGSTQSFVNAAAGLILGVGALLSPLLGYGLFSFMGTVATRPPTVPVSPGRATGQAYYATQMGRSTINGARTAVDKLRPASARTGGSATGPGTRSPSWCRGPHEATAAQRAGTPSAGTQSTTGTGSRATPTSGSGPAVAAPSAVSTGAASRGAATSAGASGAAKTAAAGVAGAPTGGIGAAVVLGGAAAAKGAADSVKKTATTTTSTTAAVTGTDEAPIGGRPPGGLPVGRGGSFGSPDAHRVDGRERSDSDGGSR